jgi:DUF971 family protein
MPTPTDIRLRKQARQLIVRFADGLEFAFPCEYLRVFSPSAEVKGHGPGQQVLQIGKENVGIDRIEPVGQYAVRLVFDDGHSTGIYSWDYLYQLGQEFDRNWQSYLQALREAGHERRAG